jgi:2-dehydropantoate 2-reductase
MNNPPYMAGQAESQPLRFLIFGAGAIGTYIGGSLALAGYPVIILERPEIAADLRRRGLSLQLGETLQRVPEPVVEGSIEDALRHGPFDLAVFAVKSYDTLSTLSNWQPYLAQMPAFLCLQNGVENEEALASVLGEGRVMAGTVTSAIGRRDAGDIVLERFRGMGVAGGFSPEKVELARRAAAALQVAGLNPRFYPRPADMKWSKMLTNLLANATSAILNMTPAEVFAHPGLFRLEMRQLRETLQVMAAQGIKVVDLPGTPVWLMAWIVRSLPPRLAQPLLSRAVGKGRGAKMPSFYLDLHAGRGKSEVEFLNGAVVRFGQKTGVPTRANALLTKTLMALTRGELAMEAFDHQPERLLELDELR